MTDSDPKADLQTYLQEARDVLRWKLEGLGEYDLRRPMTPTGTNLLGVVKHAAVMEVAYFGVCFDRPFADPMPWLEEGAAPNSDMWVPADESTPWVLDLHARACAHSDQTIAELPLDAVAHIKWWSTPEQTLHKVLVHMVAECHRHAGQLDILRELIDESAGFLPGDPCMTEQNAAWWLEYRDRVHSAAQTAAGASGRSANAAR